MLQNLENYDIIKKQVIFIVEKSHKGSAIVKLLNNKYFKTIFPVIISIILGLCGNAVFSIKKSSVSFIFAVIMMILFIVIDISLVIYYVHKEDNINQLICQSDDEIKEAMKKIIKMQGKICVMSRDLSWVDCEVKSCILAKANSVLIFAEKESELTKELQNGGVEMKYYGNWNFEPKTRFTAIRYNKNNPQVAIANTQNSIRKKGKVHHTIYQTQNNGGTDEWINSLALDMIDLCKSVCDGGSYEQKHL